jgi:hypothetical protein
MIGIYIDLCLTLINKMNKTIKYNKKIMNFFKLSEHTDII